MIAAEHSVVIGAGIDSVWDYVQDIRRWANLFPGCRECTVIDTHDSRWTIKVGAGGLVRTVNVSVHVDDWSGPEQVRFSYRLDNEPVEGSGSYLATRRGAHETEITLEVRVAGSGPMAPMWEAMSKPLLPQLAKSFSGKLKAEIEAASGARAAAESARPSFRQWLRKLWHALFRKRPSIVQRVTRRSP